MLMAYNNFNKNLYNFLAVKPSVSKKKIQILNGYKKVRNFGLKSIEKYLNFEYRHLHTYINYKCI